MPVPVFDNATTSTGSTSFSHTTSGSDRTLVVVVASFATSSITVSGATYNGVSLTQRRAVENNYTANRYLNIAILTLDNPAVGANTVAVTFSGSPSTYSIRAISYTGANNGVGANTGGDTGNSSGPSATFTTGASDSLIVGGAIILTVNGTPFTPGSGVTERTDGSSGSGFTGHSFTDGDKTATGGSDTINFTASTSNRWAIAAVEILAAAAVATRRIFITHT